MFSKLFRAPAASSRLVSGSFKSTLPIRQPRLPLSRCLHVPVRGRARPKSSAAALLASAAKPRYAYRPFPGLHKRSLHQSPILSAVRYNRRGQRLLSPSDIVGIVRHPYTPYGVLIFVSGVGWFYYSNLEEVPISGRTRFNCFSQETVEAESEQAYQQILNKENRAGKILPYSDGRVKMVERVLNRLIEGGQLGQGSVKGQGWEVCVIDDPETLNAFVLPGGKVFVYSGILPICKTDDGLAAVLGHEIAHNLAHHSAEKMSSMVWLTPVIWTLRLLDSQGYTFGLGELFGSVLLDFGIMRPSSREQESEADYIGLMLMAQCCYDPSAAVGLWQRMEEAQKGQTPPEWISTHPSNVNRIKHIQEWLPKAETLREDGGCAMMIDYSRGFQNAISSSFIE